MKRRPPAYLRLVENAELTDRVAPARGAALTITDIAAAPLIDAGRTMIDSAVEAAVDAAADFGLTTDPERLRREIRAAVTRYVDSWILQQLTENEDVSSY
jgi:hypothetical protein